MTYRIYVSLGNTAKEIVETNDVAKGYHPQEVQVIQSGVLIGHGQNLLMSGVVFWLPIGFHA
ncbi:MAG: hypothetical protein EBS03_02875 [Actinobacteria bacterium]|nr:hypothetical protein [Actinomycetota bacterium]